MVAGFYIFLMLLNGLVALYDFSFFRIPNMLVLCLILLYFVTAPFLVSANELMLASMIFVGLLALGFLFFYLSICGGGDAKYLAAAGLWAGTEHIWPLLFIVSLVGGVLALCYLLGQSRIAIYSTNLWNQILLLEKRYTRLQSVWAFSGKGPETHKREAAKSNQLPYGIAIALGSIIVLYLKMTT